MFKPPLLYFSYIVQTSIISYFYFEFVILFLSFYKRQFTKHADQGENGRGDVHFEGEHTHVVLPYGRE